MYASYHNIVDSNKITGLGIFGIRVGHTDYKNSNNNKITQNRISESGNSHIFVTEGTHENHGCGNIDKDSVILNKKINVNNPQGNCVNENRDKDCKLGCITDGPVPDVPGTNPRLSSENPGETGEPCSENSECSSGVCAEGKCVSAGLVESIMNALRGLFTFTGNIVASFSG